MVTELFSLEGRTAIITGSSRGIGEAIARKYASAGADVCVLAPAEEEENLQSVRDSINDASGGQAIYSITDVLDRSAVESMTETVVDEFDGIDILVNNVGGGFDRPFDELTDEEWNSVLEINLNGTFHCTQTAGSYLKDGGGTVINISSGAGLTGFANRTVYCGAKAAIIKITETLAFEWAHDNVRVNAIAPGLISTDRIASGFDPVPPAEDINREQVARRYGKPEEIADAAHFLASSAASYITGIVLPVMGVPRLERQLDVQDLAGSHGWMYESETIDEMAHER